MVAKTKFEQGDLVYHIADPKKTSRAIEEHEYVTIAGKKTLTGRVLLTWFDEHGAPQDEVFQKTSLERVQ